MAFLEDRMKEYYNRKKAEKVTEGIADTYKGKDVNEDYWKHMWAKELERVEAQKEEEAEEGALRYDSGKPEFHQIPLHQLAGVARVAMLGEIKYAKYNWAKGMPWSKCFDSLMRHMFKFWYNGEDYDPETNEHHLDHAICNLLYLKHYIAHHDNLDDRPRELIDVDELETHPDEDIVRRLHEEFD